MNNDLISRDVLRKELSELQDMLPIVKSIEDKQSVRFAIKVIEVLIYNAPTVPLPDYKEGYKQAILDGKTHYQRQQGEWISVSERLPDKNMICLVSVGKFNFTQIAIYSDLMGTINHKIFYQGDYGKNNFQNITEYVNAWMPLPKPYKKGERE